MAISALRQPQWRWKPLSFSSATRRVPFSRLPYLRAHLRLRETTPSLYTQADKRSSCSCISRTFQPPRSILPGLLPAVNEGRSSCASRIAVSLTAGSAVSQFSSLNWTCIDFFSEISGETSGSGTLKLLPLLLVGLGAFFSLQLPALADLGRQGKVAPTLHGARLSEILTSAWTGLMAGCLHTLTGPDHLAALAPLCVGRPKLESAVVGALWGCGHDAGQIIFGLFFLLLKEKLKLELLQVWASRIVGITLLAIGAVGFKEAQEIPVTVLASEAAGSSKTVEDRTTTHRLRTFATGIIYGLQPDALIVILPALALPSRLAGAAYLGMFLLGTVAAMGSYTAFISSCGEALQSRVPWITQRLTVGSSVVAIIFGVGILLGEVFGINFFH